LQSLRFLIKRFVVSTFSSVDVFVIIESTGSTERKDRTERTKKKKKKRIEHILVHDSEKSGDRNNR
jgi:helix-turn-helix protein